MLTEGGRRVAGGEGKLGIKGGGDRGVAECRMKGAAEEAEEGGAEMR